MDGVFDDEVEQTVTIDEYLKNVEAEELVNFQFRVCLTEWKYCFFLTLLVVGVIVYICLVSR